MIPMKNQDESPHIPLYMSLKDVSGLTVDQSFTIAVNHTILIRVFKLTRNAIPVDEVEK